MSDGAEEKKGKIIALVPCSDPKYRKWEDYDGDEEPVDTLVTEARNKYKSRDFKDVFEYAESVADKIYILSARYVLLDPDTQIKGYNETLLWEKPNARKVWAKEVLERLKPEIEVGDKIILLASKTYIEDLKELLDMSNELIDKDDKIDLDDPLKGEGYISSGATIKGLERPKQEQLYGHFKTSIDLNTARLIEKKELERHFSEKKLLAFLGLEEKNWNAISRLMLYSQGAPPILITHSVGKNKYHIAAPLPDELVEKKLEGINESGDIDVSNLDCWKELKKIIEKRRDNRVRAFSNNIDPKEANIQNVRAKLNDVRKAIFDLLKANPNTFFSCEDIQNKLQNKGKLNTIIKHLTELYREKHTWITRNTENKAYTYQWNPEPFKNDSSNQKTNLTPPTTPPQS